MLFSRMLEQVGPSRSSVHISDDWLQGRAGYGGLVSALVYESMKKNLTDSKPLRCLQISFVGPVSADALEIESEVLREGKSVSQVMGRGIQDGQTKIIVQGSFGTSRESIIEVDAERERFSEEPLDCERMPYTKGFHPAFTQHFDYRYLTPYPFAGSELDYLRGYVRYSQPEPEMHEGHLLGLVDAWPPTTLPKLKALAMASSLTWTIEFVQPMPKLKPEDFVAYDARIMHSADGYGYTRAKVWNSEGELIALSQQTVTHFA